MIRFLLAAGMFLLAAGEARAQMSYMDEVRALGAVSGQGLACGAAKYDDFELLARAIMLSKAPSDKLRNDAIYAYNEEKANAYFSKQMDGFYECTLINRRFDRQEIFKAVLYEDGTIKMPDGKVITPRQPYDATMIYKKDDKIRENLQAIYDGNGNGRVIDVRVQDSTVPAAPAVKKQAKPAVLRLKAGQSRAVSPDAGIAHLKRR